MTVGPAGDGGGPADGRATDAWAGWDGIRSSFHPAVRPARPANHRKRASGRAGTAANFAMDGALVTRLLCLRLWE
jgi:hypothetical protein